MRGAALTLDADEDPADHLTWNGCSPQNARSRTETCTFLRRRNRRYVITVSVVKRKTRIGASRRVGEPSSGMEHHTIVNVVQEEQPLDDDPLVELVKRSHARGGAVKVDIV